MLKTLGTFDAICGYATIAIELLTEELEQNSEPRDWLGRYAKGHGVTLHDVNYHSLTPRLAEMFVMLVYAHLEEFLRAFLQEHAASKLWDARGDLGLFEYVVKNLALAHTKNGADERETIEYYHLARNAVAHPDVKAARLQNQRAKVRSMLGIVDEYLPPKPVGAFDYGDFFIFTRAVKSYAVVVCQAGRPSDAEIAEMIAPSIKSLNRLRNKPQRFRNGIRQLLRMRYQMDAVEADSVIEHIVGR